MPSVFQSTPVVPRTQDPVGWSCGWRTQTRGDGVHLLLLGHAEDNPKPDRWALTVWPVVGLTAGHSRCGRGPLWDVCVFAVEDSRSQWEHSRAL